tara:strand:+ start:193 stop:336 length:144 start_codon:yes stop_codon:yes gene_type:complete
LRTTKPTLISIWLNIRENLAYKPEEWAPFDNSDLLTMEIEELMIEKT